MKHSDHPLLIGIENVEPYKLADSERLYSEKEPPMQIASFLPAGGVMGITSYPGVGKTWLTLEVVRAVATGAPFLGRFDTHQGGVIFVGSDSSVFDYARQWRRLTRHLDLAFDNSKGKAPLFDAARFLLQSSFMFENTDEVRRLIATCRRFEWGDQELRHEGTKHAEMSREKGVSVLVFDTLSRMTRANQNDNTEMEEVFRNIRHIAEFTGAAVILLHHNAKRSEFNDGSDWRGAMSQIGALDSWVQLVASRKDKYTVGVQYKKFRGVQPEDFAYKMDVNDPLIAHITASDEPVTMQQRLSHDPVAEAIMEEIIRNPGQREPDIRTAIWPQFKDQADWPDELKFKKAVNNRLRNMADRGKVTKTYNDDAKPVYKPQEAK